MISVNEFIEAGPAGRNLIRQYATESMTRAEREYLSMLFEYGVDYFESTLEMLWHWNIDEEPRQ